ncbi:MAG: hypothetical protein HFG71_04230 [Hungatella sp.]|jgi:hypothetical protein|nr:hypothetical protein [Hungatella sp.]
MNNDWQKDPRLKTMAPEKIQFLIDFSQQLNNAPKDQVLPRFLSLTAEAGNKNISFSGEETGLLTDILTGYLSPADRSRLDMFRMLSQKTAFRRS